MSMQGVEPLFQELRIRKIWSHLPAKGTIVDLGCDYEVTMLQRLQHKLQYDRLIGLDIVARTEKLGRIELKKADLTKKFPLPDKTADAVTMLAVLEHLPDPEHILREVYRILKPGGVFLVTVPSAQAELVLPTLAKLGIVRQEMIDQHYHYFDRQGLAELARRLKFKRVVVESWELGFNTFFKAYK